MEKFYASSVLQPKFGPEAEGGVMQDPLVTGRLSEVNPTMPSRPPMMKPATAKLL